VIAFAPEQEGAEVLKGSARSVRGLHIRDALALVDARRPGLIMAFGGHAMAAGLSLPRAALEEFESALVEAVFTQRGGQALTEEIFTDGELDKAELNLQTALDLEAYGPWGQQFPEPLFNGSFEVVDARIVGGSHLKMVVKQVGGGEVIDAIAFNRLPDDLPGGPVHLLYRLNINRWRGNESPQLLVEHIVF
jgi:single-stranded-DNA-specific exonuclease